MPARRLLACLLTASVLVVGACGGDDDETTSPVTVDPDEETTTTTESTTTTAPTTTIDPEDPTADVQQAFYDQWDAFVEILRSADAENPLVNEHFTGDAKLNLLNTIVEFATERKGARRPEDPADFQPRIVEVRMDSPDRATVFECTIDGIIVVNIDTGEVISDSVDSFEAKNVFVLEEGNWKVSNTSDVANGEPGCADLSS